MNRKLQVFVSSTYVDMKAERQAAVEVILQAGHIPAGMELFAAGDEAQWEIIRRWIDESDVFMLILGGRYGSIEPKSGKSYIEREYEYAVEQGKRFFAAVQSEDAIEVKVKEHGSAVREQENPRDLRAFRERVLTKMSGRFGTNDQLKLVAFQALANFAGDTSLAGWVRAAEQTIPKSVFDELERLRAENVELRATVEAHGEPELSDDAIKLLTLAVKHDGVIGVWRAAERGYFVGVGNRGRVQAVSNRGDRIELARWKSAAEELLEGDYTEDVDGQGTHFTVRHAGYEFAKRTNPTGLIQGVSLPTFTE